MNTAELSAQMRELFGEVSQKQLADLMGKDISTISRWVNGRTEMGHAESNYLRLIVALHKRNINWRAMLPLATINDIL